MCYFYLRLMNFYSIINLMGTVNQHVLFVLLDITYLTNSIIIFFSIFKVISVYKNMV